MVILLLKPDYDRNLDGLAMSIGVLEADDAFATAEVNVSTFPSYVFAHELSHLLGANHTEYKSANFIVLETSLDVISKPSYVDNFAFDYTEGNTDIQTLMGNSCETCEIIPYVSNPDIQVDIDGDGVNDVAIGVKGKRNNARAIGDNIARAAVLSDNLTNSQPETSRVDTQFGIVGIDFGFNLYTSVAFDPVFDENDQVIDITSLTYNDYNYLSGSSGWNDVTAYTSSASSVDLLNTEGNNPNGSGPLSSPVSLTIVDGFDDVERADWTNLVLMTAEVGGVPANAMADGFVASSEFSGSNAPKTSPKLEITGLDDSKQYDFKIYGNNKSMTDFNVSHYVLTGANTAEGSLYTGGHPNSVVELRDLTPQNGKITLTVKFPLAGGEVNLNAIEFYQVSGSAI